MKKVMISLVVIVVIAGLITGGVLIYQRHQDNTTFAETMSVENLVWFQNEDALSGFGMLTNEDNQTVYLISGQEVAEVYVEEGQEVQPGDPLLSYDMILTDLQLEIKELEIEGIANQIILAQRRLERLRNTTPIPDQPEEEEEPELPLFPEFPIRPDIPEMDGDAYNIISIDSVSWTGTGTISDPFRFLCTEEAFVEGSYLNYLNQLTQQVFVIFEIYANNDPTQQLLRAWQIDNRSLPMVDDFSRWSVATRQQIIDEFIPIDPEPILPEEPEIPTETQYTARELQREIQKTEGEIRDMELSRRRGEMELEQMRGLSDNGVVTATLAGVVQGLGDKDNPPMDGSPFMTVSGSEGLYVSSTLSELLLDVIQPGQVIYAMSWESGRSFEATITEISDHPSDNPFSSGTGNPNVSFYAYTAYIADTEGLRNGESVNLTMNPMNSNFQMDTGGTFFLQRAYIRQDEGGNFVMKEGENGRLVKQYVVTGRSLYGQALEILSGLSREDRIAFPYGPTAREGVRVSGGTT